MDVDASRPNGADAAPDPGRYVLCSSRPGTKEWGMHATVVVAKE